MSAACLEGVSAAGDGGLAWRLAMAACSAIKSASFCEALDKDDEEYLRARVGEGWLRC